MQHLSYLRRCIFHGSPIASTIYLTINGVSTFVVRLNPNSWSCCTSRGCNAIHFISFTLAAFSVSSGLYNNASSPL